MKSLEDASVTGGVLLAEIFEEVDMPPGVLNVIKCSREDAMSGGAVVMSNPVVRRIPFTGSTQVERIVVRIPDTG